jgi:hypothetical protein
MVQRVSGASPAAERSLSAASWHCRSLISVKASVSASVPWSGSKRSGVRCRV